MRAIKCADTGRSCPTNDLASPMHPRTSNRLRGCYRNTLTVPVNSDMAGAPEIAGPPHTPLTVSTSRNADCAWPGALDDIAVLFTHSPSYRRADSAPVLCGEACFAPEDLDIRSAGAPLSGLAKYEKIRGLESGSFGSLSIVRVKPQGSRSRAGSRSYAALSSIDGEEPSISGRDQTYALKTVRKGVGLFNRITDFPEMGRISLLSGVSGPAAHCGASYGPAPTPGGLARSLRQPATGVGPSESESDEEAERRRSAAAFITPQSVEHPAYHRDAHLPFSQTDLRDVYVERLGISPEFKAEPKRVKRAMTEFRLLYELPEHPLFPRLCVGTPTLGRAASPSAAI